MRVRFSDSAGPPGTSEFDHFKQLMNWRSQAARHRASREKASLSYVWNWAQEQAYSALPNPCAGGRSNHETGREVYMKDELLEAVWRVAAPTLRDAVDLVYPSGHRVADTLRMDERDLPDGFLLVGHGKTGVRSRIELVGELAELIGRVAARKHSYSAQAPRLIVDEQGQPLT